MKRTLTFLTTLLCMPAGANSFGIYDARSMAMGGTAVAVGSVDMASGHNPALLGLYDEDEDKSRNGRYMLPYAIGGVSQVAIDAIDLLQDELDILFDNALDTYNELADNSAPDGLIRQAAGEAAVAALNLENALIEIANKDIRFSVFAPLIAVAEPGERGGGGFYFGARVEGGGRSFIPDEDIALFDEYVQALEHLENGGDWRVFRPLFNASPTYDQPELPPFNDPIDQISSRADIIALAIAEAAVAWGWGFDYETLRVAVGITPKVMSVRVFDESREVTSDDLEADKGSKAHMMFNTDIGVAIQFQNGVRVAYTGKDIIARDFDTATGNSVELASKHRVGFAYIRPTWQVGMDYDMKPSIPMSIEAPTQLLTIGGEYTILRRIHLRAGYRFDTETSIADAFTGGIGFNSFRMQANLSYLKSSDDQGAALQLGFSF